jgi:DNA-binding protein HU-beta
MNKTDLANIIATKHDTTKAVAADILNTVLTSVIEAVKTGDTVQLVGFGTFKPAARAAREGRNPSTGEAISIAAAILPKFAAGTAFKEAVNIKPVKAVAKKKATPALAKQAAKMKK